MGRKCRTANVGPQKSGRKCRLLAGAANVGAANVGPQKSGRKCRLLAGAANVGAANVGPQMSGPQMSGHVDFIKGNFNELYAFLEGQKFPRQIHPKLQKIWWDVHFLEAEQTLGKSPLTPIQKYKVREKHPLPATIWEKNGVFKENEMILINEYFTRTQYIAVSQKLLLALVTGLSMTLIASWFKNLRLKQKKAQRMKMLSHAKMPSAELEEKDEDDLFDEMPPFTNLFLLN